MRRLDDWRCNFCGHRFEAMTEGEDERPQCEACQSDNCTRAISAPKIKKLGGLDRVMNRQEMKREAGKNQEEKAMNPRGRRKDHWKRVAEGK